MTFKDVHRALGGRCHDRAVLIVIYWVITGTSLDAPVAPRRVRTS
ncbi:hypothetical protein ABIC93_005032 [Variovorax paradoxus]